MEVQVQVAEGSAGPNFLMFSMVIMIDMYIWHMAYVCVLLRIKKKLDIRSLYYYY